MAGLLDFFMPSEDPVQAQMKMALAAGLLSANGSKGLGAGLLGASDAQMRAKAAQAEAEDRKLKRGLLEAQIDETKAQGEERRTNLLMRQRRAEQLGNWLSQIEGAPGAANQAVIAQTGGLAPTLANATIQSQAFERQTAGNPLADVDPRAARADMMLNEGKNIPEWLFKRTTPDMQNINGVWVNKNTARDGDSIPQMSPTGQGYQLIKDPSVPGGFRVATPAGAVDTYRDFKRADAGITAENDLVTVTLPGGPKLMTKAQALELTGGRPAPAASPVAPRQPQANPGALIQPGDNDRRAIYSGELKQAQARLAAATTPEEKNRAANDINSLKREMERIGMPADGPGVQLKTAPTKGQETLDAEFAKEHAVFGAGGGYADVQKQLTQLAEAASKLKKGSGVTGPMVGLMPDKLRTLTNPEAVDTMEQVLETAQRNLRVVLGPQFTAKEGEALLGRVYNPMLKPEVNQLRVNRLITQIRKAAEAKADAGKYFDEHGTLAGWSGKLPSFADFDPAESRVSSGKVGEAPQGQVFDTRPTANASNKGRTVTDTTTGKRYRSNGLSWVEE